jgi:hypothetical protein
MQIIDVIKSLLQSGTGGEMFLREVRSNAYYSRGLTVLNWSKCPAWPPDVFAVAATLIEKSSCCMFAGPDPAALDDHRSYFEQVFSAAKKWTEDYVAPAPVQALWDALLAFGNVELSAIKSRKDVRDVLFSLLAMADEACNGAGWAPVDKSTSSAGAQVNLVVRLVMTSLIDEGMLLQGEGPVYVLPFAPISLCSLIMNDVAVVLPKSMTASVGCTIRSMSHHLALLPSSLQVQPRWKLVDQSFAVTPDQGADGADHHGLAMRRKTDHPSTLHLLLVPYPFHIPETSFQLRGDSVQLNRHASTNAFFELRQLWLQKQADGSTEKSPLDAASIVDGLLAPLLEQAKLACGSNEIHGIVMPECALSHELANAVAALLREKNIDFFITGVLDPVPEQHKTPSALPHNRASTFLFLKDAGSKPQGTAALLMNSQSKHHRWSLDPQQVKRYALNFPERSTVSEAHRAKQWWEGIDISDRDLPFYAIRQGVSLAVLICEDLARTDPAMTVIRAVGPNLVIALLMDGPQLETRWPARYATVLADDPGSSVLTLTCAALVDRANWMQSQPIRSIALWRESNGSTRELNLPAGHQGMCLTLTAQNVAQYTMDNRSDSACTQKLSLRSAIPLAIATSPNWL